ADGQLLPVLLRRRCRHGAALSNGAAGTRCGGRILDVSYMLHPGDVASIQRLLHRDVHHTGARRPSMPVLFARRNPDDVAGPDLPYRCALSLNPADARDDGEGLGEWMCW